MTKKQRLAVGMLVVFLCWGASFLALSLRQDDTKASFDRIKHGMTKAEVEEIFGRKSDDKCDGTYGPAGTTSLSAGGGDYSWRSGDGSWASVEFGKNRVITKRWDARSASLFYRCFGVDWEGFWN
jgi:hypothetical protein